MASPPTNLYTPEQWRDRLAAQLAERRPLVELYREYYGSQHRMSFATAKFKEAFGDLFSAFADNWCELVVDVAVDRMGINGFRFSGTKENDEAAWTAWQSNRMDAGALMAHTEAVKTGWAYVIVGPPEDGSDVPRFTIEHPLQVIVECDPADYSVRLAALKRYADAEGNVIDVVYEPDRITTFTDPSYRTRVASFAPDVWLPPTATGVGVQRSQSKNELGEVPVIPLENNRDLLAGGVSDLRPAIRLNDAANKFFSDMIVASEYQAFRQRVLTGVEIPKDPVTGQPLTDIEMAVSRLMVFSAPDAKAFDLQQAPLENYIQAIEMVVQHMAAQTRTPPHYLLAKLVNLSGDALKAAESGLSFRVRRKFIDFSDSWEDVIRLGFKWLWLRDDDEAAKERSEDMELQTDWAPPETQALSVVSDSLSKKNEIGWPKRMLFAEGGMSEQDIRRAEQLLEDERQNELPELDVLQRVQLMHDALGIPYEVLWKKYLGMSDAEIEEALEKGPLLRAPAERNQLGQAPNGGDPQTQSRSDSGARRDAALARGGSSR